MNYLNRFLCETNLAKITIFFTYKKFPINDVRQNHRVCNKSNTMNRLLDNSAHNKFIVCPFFFSFHCLSSICILFPLWHLQNVSFFFFFFQIFKRNSYYLLNLNSCESRGSSTEDYSD